MVDASSWWANRLGRTAAATTSGAQSQPNYGVAFDVASAPLTDSQYEEAVNAIQTQSEEEALRASVLNWGQALIQSLPRVTGKARKKSFWDRVKGGVSDFMALDPVGDITGKDLDERRETFSGGVDAVVPESVREFDPVGDVTGRDLEQRRTDAVDVMEGFDRALDTLPAASNIVREQANGWHDFGSISDWLDGSTWEEAWERADNTTAGRSLAESILLDPETRVDYHEEGFDEAGMPLDANYRELREHDTTYNLISGTADFLKSWFADPLVIGAKAGTLTRAAIKGDVDRLGRRNAAQMRRVVSAPDSVLPRLKQEIKPWDVIGQRSLALREQVGSLRDRVRSGELDPNRLVEQNQAFKENPAAAHLFAELSGARKWDADNLRYTEEFDDDVFYHGVGAMLGSGDAYDKLRVAFGDQGRGIADYIDTLRTTELPKLDEDLALAQVRYEEALTDPELTGFQAYERALNAQQDLATTRRNAEMVKGRLEEYESYGRFIANTDDLVANSTLNLVPRAGRSVGDVITDTSAHSYRPSSAAGNTATYIKYPVAALRARPGVVDLSREVHTQMGRYFDDAAAHGRAGLPETWAEIRNEMLNRAAAATTDVDRRRLSGQAENLGVEIIARKHGLDAVAARSIAADYKGRRAALFRDVERQAAENRAYSAADSPLTYKWTENGDLKEVELPLTLSQLQNYFIPMDLKALDSLLTQHGSSIKALAASKNFAADFASYFEAWWKPAVLFRVGYITRNLSDEALRGVAALDSLGSLLVDMPKAATIGMANMPRRAINRTKRFKKKELIPQVGSRGPVVQRSLQGDVVESTAAFEQGVGDIFRSVNSSGSFHRAMTSSYEGNLSRMRAEVAQGRHSVVGDTSHAGNWLHTIDNQLRPDPVVRARLEGKELADWLKTKEGREHGRRIPWRAADPYVWQTELDNHLNAMLPTERLREMVRTDTPLTEQDLQQIIDSRREAAPKAIDSSAVDMTLGTGVSRFLNDAKDKIYNAIATVPSDTLVRNPFFNRMYKSRVQAQIDTLPAGSVVDKQMQKVMERQAREYALRQTRRYMFSLADQTDLTHSIRFLSSFMGAWQETLTRWGRIITERPEQLVRLYVNGWQNIDKLPGVEFVDENGLGQDDPDHGELSHIRMPFLGNALKFADPVLPGDQTAAAEVFETFNINKNGLNTVLQGNPWWLPGTSPFAQFPAKYMLGDSPHLADDGAFSSFMYKYLFPAGVPEEADFIFPAGWMQQTRRLMAGVEDPVFNRMMATRVHQQDKQNWINGGRVGDAPTELESIEKAEAAQVFMIAARFASPAGFTPEVKSQFFIDAANRIQSELGYGEEAYQKFLDEYGEDAWLWWQATSQSNTGVPATSSGFLGQQKYKEQIEKYPEMGLALVGLGTETDEFNYQVYDWQGNTPISDADPRTQRAPRGADNTVAAAEEREGWRRWNSWSTKIDAELSARGLYSTQQSGAEDLAILKRQLADGLMQELPGWAEAYTSFDTDKSYGIVRQMQELIDNGEAPERVDWYGVEQYLEIHSKVGAELDSRMQVGGSRDITADSNADLQLAYDYLVGELKQQNLMFADLFDRMLSNHQLTLGSGRV